MKAKSLKNLRLRWLAIGVVLVGALFWGKRRLNRFPHLGTWIGQSGKNNAPKTTVSFYPDNSCSWHLDGEMDGQPNSEDYVCSYTMHAGLARVELRLPDSQFINGKWRFARTPAERAQAPLVSLITFFEVRPLDNGQTLYAKSVGSGNLDQETNKITYYAYDEEKTLTRVNE